MNAPARYPRADSAWEARFLLMSEHWVEQTNELGNCNKRMLTINEWVERQTELEAN